MQPATSDKTFHLKWNNHLQNLSQLFTTIYSSSALADVTLSCRDGSIRAHKLVLSACSPYFEQIFKDNPCKHPVIILKGIPYAEINSLVEFMYKGSVDVQELDLQSLMHTASELEIRGLAYELRKDASSLLNVNLNESPFYSSTPLTSRDMFPAVADNASRVAGSPFDSTPRNVNSYQTNMERLRQIHMYQQAMCPTAGRPGLAGDLSAPKRKRRNDETMPANTTTAVENILAAAAKELAQKDIQVETPEVKMEPEEDESGDGECEALPHGRDTRFKGKKRVAVGLQQDYEPAATAKSKLPKKSVKYMIKPTEITENAEESVNKLIISAVSGGDGSVIRGNIPGILKCVDLDNLRGTNPQIVDENEDSSALDTSDDNNLLVERTYESFGGQEDEYDSSDSKPPIKVSEKTFKCDLCDLSYGRKAQLAHHRYKHLGERPFKCSACPFSFNRSSHLARHRRTHTGERPYRCEACGRCFARGDKLKLHMRICEKDEYVLPSHLAEDSTSKPNKKDAPQSMVVPGMVSVEHSERSQLMFTPGGDVMLAPRASDEGEESCSASPAPGTASSISTSFYGGEYPIKRGRGRPRKKPLDPVTPLVKKRRGRPPKVIKMDPMDPTRPMDNYTASNLPYGDFSYLTDIISTHFNQSSPQAYSMIQRNSNIVNSKMTQQNTICSETSANSIIPSVACAPSLGTQTSDGQRVDSTPKQEITPASINTQTIGENISKATETTETQPVTNSKDSMQQNLKKEIGKVTSIQPIPQLTPLEVPQAAKITAEPDAPQAIMIKNSLPDLINSEENYNIIPASNSNTENNKVMMVGDCQILKIDSSYDAPSKTPEKSDTHSDDVVSTIGDCTIQPINE